MRRLLSLFLALGLLASARASELADLGQGLTYLRVHSFGAPEKALFAAVPGTGALVLDLRYATAGEESTAALRAALAGRPATAPLFILVSPQTPATIAAIIPPAPGFTLGAPDSASAPKVVVHTDAAADRRAYDALEAGIPLATLVSGKIEKERFDEATLVKEFKNGNYDAEPPPPPDPTAPPAVKPAEKPAPLTDRVLQRAVHLHRALLALRRSAG